MTQNFQKNIFINRARARAARARDVREVPRDGQLSMMDCAGDFIILYCFKVTIYERAGNRRCVHGNQASCLTCPDFQQHFNHAVTLTRYNILYSVIYSHMIPDSRKTRLYHSSDSSMIRFSRASATESRFGHP